MQPNKMNLQPKAYREMSSRCNRQAWAAWVYTSDQGVRPTTLRNDIFSPARIGSELLGVGDSARKIGR
jgi:hypothetical protein